MAEFQTKVGAPKPGLPGSIVNPKRFTAAITDSTLKPGDFAFETASEYGQDACFVSKTGSNLLGIVKHGFMPYTEGATIDILVSGAIYAVVPEGQTPSSGQAVLCDPDTGEVTYGKTGDPNDTGWKVLSCDPGNGLVVYEKL